MSDGVYVLRVHPFEELAPIAWDRDCGPQDRMINTLAVRWETNVAGALGEIVSFGRSMITTSAMRTGCGTQPNERVNASAKKFVDAGRLLDADGRPKTAIPQTSELVVQVELNDGVAYVSPPTTNRASGASSWSHLMSHEHERR